MPKNMIDQTVYYKTITLGDERFRVVTQRKMSNEEFTDKLNYVRRVFGYAMYPRWAVTRVLLNDTYDMLRKNGLYKHNVKRMAKLLNAEYDAFEKLHMTDFDQDWIEVMSGSMANSIMPKLNTLRGAVGGVLMNNGIKHYAIYSYPETICVMANEGCVHHDMLMQEVLERYGMALKDIFRPLRGDKVLACAYSLMSAIEDVVGEELPRGLDARNTSANVAMKSIERALINENYLAKAFGEAGDEIEERDQTPQEVVAKLSEKFKVTRQ